MFYRLLNYEKNRVSKKLSHTKFSVVFRRLSEKLPSKVYKTSYFKYYLHRIPNVQKGLYKPFEVYLHNTIAYNTFSLKKKKHQIKIHVNNTI